MADWQSFAPGEYLVARFGTAYMRPTGEWEPGEVVSKLNESLEADWRVSKLWPATPNEEWDWTFDFWPLNAEPEELLKGNDGVKSLRVDDPFVMELSVPVAAQPLYHDFEDIPTEDYLVWWDGVDLFVFWKQTGEDYTSQSGGQVAYDVLQDAAHECDCHVYRQACTRTCDDVFTHTSVRVYSDGPDPTGWVFAEDEGSITGVAGYTGAQTPWDAANSFYRKSVVSLNSFSRMKNIGRRILELEEVARDDLSLLLELGYDEAQRRGESVWKRLKGATKHMRDRRKARAGVARTLLAMANIDRLRRYWSEERLEFERWVADELDVLFERDHVLDVSHIQAMDLTPIANAVEHSAGRLDTRLIVIASTASALAGGAVGALVTVLLS